jgi:hypothetical protein
MKTNYIQNAAVLALFLGESSVKADQPVHCLRQDIYGDWTFTVSKDQELINLFEARDICTHNMPNGVQVIDKNYKFAFA